MSMTEAIIQSHPHRRLQCCLHWRGKHYVWYGGHSPLLWFHCCPPSSIHNRNTLMLITLQVRTKVPGITPSVSSSMSENPQLPICTHLLSLPSHPKANSVAA